MEHCSNGDTADLHQRFHDSVRNRKNNIFPKNRGGLNKIEIIMTADWAGAEAEKNGKEAPMHISYNPVDHLLIVTNFFGFGWPDSTLVYKLPG